MHIPLVDLKAQYAGIRDEVGRALQEVLDETCFILGPPVTRFEENFAKYCAAKECIGVASGTDALHLIFRALGIGPGDEVIVPAFTFVATALGVSLAGATPVLVDVRKADALIDPDRIEGAITSRTKAIVAVHLYGRCADIGAWRDIADRRGIHVIEDACQAHGATLDGRRAGSLGTAAAFSFYPGKNLGAYGDGGAITTNDAALADRLRLVRNWGSVRKYHHEEVGLNSRLDSMQAAVLDIKLKHLDAWNKRRVAHAAHYDQLLAAAGIVTPFPATPGSEPIYHTYVIRVPNRDARVEWLNSQGVGVGIHYPFPIHRLKAYRSIARTGGSLAESDAWAAECLSLPIYPELTSHQREYVVATLRSFHNKAAA
jgi:dTDP-4-amino-4,6-dideoxygalactose transaminase